MSSTQHSTSEAAPGPALTVEREHVPGSRFVRYTVALGTRHVGHHSVHVDVDSPDVPVLLQALHGQVLSAHRRAAPGPAGPHLRRLK
jgi:hypothetical protein